MKRDENEKYQDLQRDIEEQEQAMSALLQRVMAQPLVPLHKSFDKLSEQLAAVQQANTRAAQAVEAGLSEALEGQGKRFNRQLGEVTDGIDGLKEELGTLASTLDKQHSGQVERDEIVQGSLHRADGMLAQLDARASAAGDSLAAAASAVAKMDADLGTMREQEHALAGQLNKEFDGLTRQLHGQQAQLCERIDTLQPGLAAQLASLAATVDGSAKEVARQYETLSETQKAVVSATVQEQLALQLAPVQAQAKWLFALCGLSFASTLALLGMQLFR